LRWAVLAALLLGVTTAAAVLLAREPRLDPALLEAAAQASNAVLPVAAAAVASDDVNAPSVSGSSVVGPVVADEAGTAPTGAMATAQPEAAAPSREPVAVTPPRPAPRPRPAPVPVPRREPDPPSGRDLLDTRK
jgi:hypothetical protein